MRPTSTHVRAAPRRFARRALALAAAAWLAWMPAQAADAPPDPVVAQRGTVTLTASQVRQMIAAADPETRQQMQRDPQVLLQRVRDRLIQLVLLDRAQAEKWDQQPDIAYRAELAREGAIVESYVAAQAPVPADFPSDQEIAAAYDANKSRLMLSKQYHLAQILVAVPPDAAEAATAQAQKHAADLRKQIVDGHKDFAQVAGQASDDKVTAGKGGDLGWVREDVMVPALRQALGGLAAGAVTEPVHTPDGWHVLKVLAIRPATVATPAEAHDTLVRALRQERSVQLQRRYVAELLQQDPVHIDQVQLWQQTAQ